LPQLELLEAVAARELGGADRGVQLFHIALVIEVEALADSILSV
jgi:hypothetical protein